MEEKTKTEVEEKVEEKEEPVTKKDPFSLIGKIAVIVILLAILIGGGIFLGMNLGKSSNTAQVNPTLSLSPSTTTQTSPTVSSNSGQVITPTAAQITKTVTAGGGTGSSFGTYTIDIPSGWTDTTTKTEITTKLTLTKGNYSMSIYQAPMGGGGCVYPGDPASEMSQSFSDFVQITGAHNNLRRSWNKTGNPAGTISYTVCEGPSGTYGSPTSYGAIGVKSPDPVDATVMKDIDSMIASLTKK